jgi:hypothetical protein
MRRRPLFEKPAEDPILPAPGIWRHFRESPAAAASAVASGRFWY